MKTFVQNRIFVVFLVCIAVFFVFAVSANAADDDPAAVSALVSPAIWILNGILLVIRMLVGYLLSIASMLLTKMFWLNILAVPSLIPVVPIMWAALRDLTNGIFLLAILWVSLTIIFNLENLGGKRLLMRIVMVALLINFSLLMVTMVFGVANQLAAIFAKNMPVDPGTFIVTAIDIVSVGTVLDKEGIEKIKNEEKRKIEETKRQLDAGDAITIKTSVKDTLLASLGVETAYAAGPAGFYFGCGAGLLLTVGGAILMPATFGASAAALGGGVALAAAMCGGLAVAGAATDYYIGWASGIVNIGNNIALKQSGQIIFLLITTITMFYGAIVLLIRYAAMIALSVLAPVAFVAAMIPQTKRYFDRWLSALLQWAFFLPIFYLMLYLGFYIISGIDSAATNGMGPTSLDRIMIVFVGVLFMWMGLRIAKKTGGAIAEAGLGALAKVGLFAAGGAAGLAMRGAGAAIAAQPERAQEWAARARRIPIVGRQIQRAMGQPIERDRKEVEKRQEEMKNFSVPQLGDYYRTSSSRHEKIAAARLLVEREKLDEIATQKNEAYRLASNIGMAKEFLTLDPTLAIPTGGDRKEDAIKKTVEKLQDKTKISKLALDPAHTTAPDRTALIEALVTHASTKELSKIGMQNKALMQATMDHLDILTHAQMDALKDEIRNKVGDAQVHQLTEYFTGNLAGGIGPRLGWRTPTNW